MSKKRQNAQKAAPSAAHKEPSAGVAALTPPRSLDGGAGAPASQKESADLQTAGAKTKSAGGSKPSSKSKRKSGGGKQKNAQAEGIVATNAVAPPPRAVAPATQPSPSAAPPSAGAVTPRPPSAAPTVGVESSPNAPSLAALAAQLPASLDPSPPAAARESAPPQAPIASPPRTEREDEISVPPASDFDDDFFSAEAALPSSFFHADVAEFETRDPRLAQLMTAEAQRRRAHLTKYVKAVIVGSLCVCLAAIVSVGIRRNYDESPTRGATPATQSAAAPIEAPFEAHARPSDLIGELPPPSAISAALPEATSAESAPAASVGRVDADPSAPSVATPPAASQVAAALGDAGFDSKRAGAEKRKAQQLLEAMRTDDSVAHGEESVKLDPTDAEAWLILGAAYQAKGNMKDARRCFVSCLKEGRRGSARAECSSFVTH